MIRVVFLIVSLIAAPVAAQESPPPATKDSQQPQFSENVEVVAVTPIHGLGVPKSKVAANVQVIVPPAVPALAPSDTARLLAERATSVTVTDSQAGTFQPDMLFRGFTGSPLLGSSEGLAVYQDGVRMNEAFGDTVSWDAIPATAIASLNLIPGSNPLFGLNALGGALSIRTKDGFSAPGSRGSFRGGSFGRYDVEAESGGQNGRLGYYLAGSLNTEDGWRDHSPSTVRRLFGDVGWRGTDSQFNVSFTGASNDLTGNGPSPEPLLAEDRAAVFTYPDRTDNDVAMAAARFLSSRSYGHVDGVAYYRYTALRTFNGDWAGDEAEGDFDAINNHSYTRSDAFGATGQLSRGTPLAGRDNHFVVGAGLDSAATRFDFSAEWAHLTPDRGTIGSGLFDEDDAVDLHSRTTTGSVFATNIWSATSRLARHRFGAVQLDRRPPARPDRRRPHGDHTFGRLNPAAGVTFQATPRVNLYASYTQSSRVPTPVELTCADPEDPCRLPNSFVSDPPLDQIVAGTWEGGARGSRGGVELESFRVSHGRDRRHHLREQRHAARRRPFRERRPHAPHRRRDGRELRARRAPVGVRQLHHSACGVRYRPRPRQPVSSARGGYGDRRSPKAARCRAFRATAGSSGSRGGCCPASMPASPSGRSRAPTCAATKRTCSSRRRVSRSPMRMRATG